MHSLLTLPIRQDEKGTNQIRIRCPCSTIQSRAGLGVQLYIPDNGKVEPYGSDDPDEIGSLGWVHDWCIRPVGVKGFYKYNLQRRKEVSKHTRRKKLAVLYTIEDAGDYAYCPKYYRESTYRP